MLKSALEVGRMTRIIRDIWFTYLPGQAGLIHEKKLSRCDLDRSRELNSIASNRAPRTSGMVEPCF